MVPNPIRNFCIISHIDHGKTTLTDRLLEFTGTVEKRLMRERFLDSNPIERERGITIKLTPVRMIYKFNNETMRQWNNEYILNLIDTPGHIDFTYEVSRSLNACEGAILLVDASVGIQAQTMSNAYLALENDLFLIPAVNKIDLPNAQSERVADDLKKAFGFMDKEILFISAKTGQGVDKLLEEIVKKVPPPKGKTDKPLRALVFNSSYHSHKGVIVYVRIVDGQITTLPSLKFLASEAEFEPLEIGYFTPKMTPSDQLLNGEVGYIATGLKNISLCKVGDTVTKLKIKNEKLKIIPLPGYKEPKPMVFMEFYPVDNKDFPLLQDALDKLKLNDASLSFRTVSSQALGKGMQVGFLGLLHAEVVQEKLEREFDLELVATTPTVEYQIIRRDGTEKTICTPTDFPESFNIKETREPYIEISIFTPARFLGQIIQLCQAKRAKLLNQEYFGDRVHLVYEMPLVELITGFFDNLKSVSSGFASLDWKFIDFRPIEAVRLDVLVHKQKVDALSAIVVKEKAYHVASKLAKKLKEVLPRQLFEVPIQVCIGGKVIARETLKAYRKDVTAKLYGGDQTRKDKLLGKQKKGKKRMKQIGRISIPQEAFLAVLKT